MRIFLRISGFPFFVCLALLASLYLWVKYCINYARYGAEAIVYTNDHQRKTIKDIYDLIEEKYKNEIPGR